MKVKTGYFIAFVVFLAVLASGTMHTIASDTPDMGEEVIVLTGGSRGNITFPHHEHQAKYSDCNVCHDMFPKEAGVINKLKEKGDLDGKDVMNGKCLSCHRKLAKEGKPSGPTSCSSCHKK